MINFLNDPLTFMVFIILATIFYPFFEKLDEKILRNKKIVRSYLQFKKGEKNKKVLNPEKV